jgi:hypothetical protein
MSMKVILGHICVSWPLFQERSVVNLGFTVYGTMNNEYYVLHH